MKIGADTSYSNIRNYNNPGDAIPELPLSRWGYERYGITINLSTQSDIYQNFEQRFKSVETKAYAGILNTDSFVSAMQIIANDRSAFYSKENHLLFDIAAYLLGPVSNKNIGFRADEFAVILKNNDVTGSLKKALNNIISSTVRGGLTSATNAQHQADTDFLVLIDAGLDDTMNASEDEISSWISRHSSLCSKIQDDLGITVDSRSKLVSARSELVSKMNKVSYVTSNLESVYYLYFSTNGNISDAIAHAHQPSTYVLWINSMYYGYGGWRGNDTVTKVVAAKGGTIGNYCYSNCGNLAEVVISDDHDYIGYGVFQNCKELNKVSIVVDYDTNENKAWFSGSPVQEIYYTKGKTGIMPDIDPNNYYYDNSFNMRLEYAVKDTLKKVSFEEGITRIGAYAYGYWGYNNDKHTDLTEIDLPDTLTSIGSHAFYGQESLKKVEIPENVTEIESAAFAYCTSFTSTESAKLPSKMDYIPARMYQGCSGITEIVIPEGIKTIKSYAYDGLSKVRELEIPESVEEIYSGAFYEMSSLQKVTIPVDYQYLSKLGYPFGKSPVQEIYYTKGRTGIMPNIRDTSGYDNSCGMRLEYAVRDTLKKVSFEKGVTNIGENAYGNWYYNRIHTNLIEINLPDTLTSIGKYAFYGQESLENIMIPKSVSKIEDYAFARCNTNFWGFKSSIAETFASENRISFKILNYPYLESNINNVEPGKTYSFTATVYTGINETTEDVIWSVQGSTSENTTIDENGLLTVGDDERAQMLSVSATYGEETSSVNLSVNIVPTATFVGDISTVIAADGENHIARPVDLEESGYQYSYYLDKRQILEDEWPLTIDSDVTINVVKKEMHCHITYHLDGGVNALDNPESYPVTNPYIELSNPMKEHYEFLGWYLDENFETQLTQETALSGDVDIFAKWQGVLHTITFDVNGGNALENSSKDVRYGEEIGLLDDAVWDNHIFLGWFTSIDGGIQIIAATICEGNLTVYAHWSEIGDEHKHSYEYRVVTNPTCTETGMGRYTCSECGNSYDEIIEALGHGETEIRNAVAATTENEGYTGDTYCKVCNALLEKGTVIERLTEEHTHEYKSYVTKEATCLEAGEITYLCGCGDVYTEEIPATGHQNIEIKNVKAASCSSEGYSGDQYCSDCGTLIEEGQVIAATGHGATEIRNKKAASYTSEGYTGDIYCTICNQKISSGNTIAKLIPQTATPGKIIKDKSTNGVYKVLKDGLSVEFTKSVSKKKAVRIPDTIEENGITYKVTEISANALKNNTSLKSVTIGNNITVIGTKAFYGCKKLSKVNGGTGIVKISDKAFAGCEGLRSITIVETVRSIGKQAFYNCKKLRNITIKTNTLSGKVVGAKAFKGIYKKPTVKVPEKQMNAYKKLLKSKGMSSKAVYKK